MHNFTRYSGRVAEALTHRMDARNISCDDIAQMTGYSIDAIRLWRIGKRPIPLDAIPKLAGALGCKNVVEFMPSMQTVDPTKRAGGIVKGKTGGAIAG